MAIDYINVSIVSHRRGQTAAGLAAYIGRYNVDNPLTGRKHRFARDAGDLLFPPEILLPNQAPMHFRDPRQLWLAAERAEVIVDRKDKTPRFRANAAFAKHVILAMPKELTNDENWELGLAWAKAKYPGVAVMAAMHRSDTEETGNVHIHLLVSTREVGAGGFGKKARHLDPRFAGKAGTKWHHIESEDLPGQWRAFQTDFFRRKGILLSVDPSRALRGVHWGKARFIPGNDKEADDRAVTEAARLRMLAPANVLVEATKNRATFTRQRLLAILKAHNITGGQAKAILDRVFSDPDTLQLFDPETGKPLNLFTTRTVRDQETRILKAATTLAKRSMPAVRWSRLKAAVEDSTLTKALSPEQLTALQHVVEDCRISLVRGLAGAGKSFTMQAMRGAYEQAGYRVIGLAPTNTVVASMAVDGFSYAATLHTEKYRQEPHSRWHAWDNKTCIIVDEAGMVDSEMLEWLLTSAAQCGAKVILVGDEAQLTSVARGGMFGILKRTFGAAELRDVRRQEADWAKAASLDFAQGRISEGLAAYDARGRIHWSNELDDAANAPVARFKADFEAERERPRFAYCATNTTANELNGRLQRVQFGDRVDFEVYDCDRGRIVLYPGDRVQFHATDRQLGIMNGHVGNVISMAPDEIVVDIDNGGRVSFDPRNFTGWGLGYAGTVYRGQGKTLPQAYALYDNAFSWSARSTYVAFTRHKQAFDFFVPRSLAKDLEALGRQMSRRDGADASHAYLTAAEAAIQFPRLIINAMAEDGQSRPVDAADPASAPLLDIHWELVQPAQFRRDYNRLKKAAKQFDKDHPIRDLAPNAHRIATKRGFYPWNGKPDLRCFDFISWEEDGLARAKSPALKPPKGTIDVRPVVVDIERLKYRPWFKLSRRLRQLDHTVLQALERRLSAVANAVHTTADLFSDIVVAKYCVRLAQLLKCRDAKGRLRKPRSRKDFLAIRKLDPVPRQTRGRFRLQHNHPQYGWSDIDLLGFVTKREQRRAAAALAARLTPQIGAAAASSAPPPSKDQQAQRIPHVSLESIEVDERASVLGGAALTPTPHPGVALKPTANPVPTQPHGAADKSAHHPTPATPPARKRSDDGPAL